MKRHVTVKRTGIAAAAIMLTLSACGSASEVASATPQIVIEGTTSSTAAPADASADAEDVVAASVEPESEADSADAESAPALATDEEKVLAFADCMRGEGIDFDDPTVDAQGGIVAPDNLAELSQTPGFDAASEQCQPLLAGASFLPTDSGMVDLQDQLLDVAACLRDFGIDVDDPDIVNNPPAGPGANIFPGFDPDDPANAEAVAECSQLVSLPGGGQ